MFTDKQIIYIHSIIPNSGWILGIPGLFLGGRSYHHAIGPSHQEQELGAAM